MHPYRVALHKYFFELLKEKYGDHTDLLERLSHYLVTEKDLQDLGALVSDVYEVAYRKSILDYQAQLAAKGVHVSLVFDKQPYNLQA